MIENRIILAVCILSAVSSCTTNSSRELPIYGPSDFRPELVDKDLRNSDEKHTIADFQLVNQNGTVVTQDDYSNTDLMLVENFQ